MRQKRWRRAGITLSIVWLVAAGYWGLNSGLHKGDFAVRQFTLCMENSAHPGDARGQCLARFDKDYPEAIQYRWWRALVAGVMPMSIGWFLMVCRSGFWRRRNRFKTA
jgi:hypothetical protein